MQTPWKPDVAPMDIQSRLNMIATAGYQKIETVGDPKLTLAIAFGEKNQWDGAWDGKYFVWKSGPFKDKGFETSADTQTKFEAGSLAFEKKDLNWCPQRIETLEVQFGSLKYRLRQDGLRWIINDKIVDPTFVEQWLGRACSNHIEEHIDKDLVSGKYQFDGHLSAQFADGKTISWKVDSTAPAFENATAEFLSPTLYAHLKELPNAPVLGDAPPPAVKPAPKKKKGA
jgi:hypothetical protein